MCDIDLYLSVMTDDLSLNDNPDTCLSASNYCYSILGRFQKSAVTYEKSSQVFFTSSNVDEQTTNSQTIPVKPTINYKTLLSRAISLRQHKARTIMYTLLFDQVKRFIKVSLSTAVHVLCSK